MQMRRLLMVGIACVGFSGAVAAQTTPGRYQATAMPGGQGGPPVLVLLDTTTGQSWVLLRLSSGLLWYPIHYYLPLDQPMPPLPPRPEQIGTMAPPRAE